MEVENINVKRKELKQMMNVIKSKKKILFFTFLSMVVLFGCSNGEGLGASNNNGKEQSVAEKLYKDLDAKETYEKAIEYFNENVTYVKRVDKEKQLTRVNEKYNENGKYTRLCYVYYVDEASEEHGQAFIYAYENCCDLYSSNHKFDELREYGGSGSYLYEQEQYPFMSSLYSAERGNVHDISKEEDGDHTVIKIKFENTNNVMSYDEETQWYVDKGEVRTDYRIYEIIIDSSGLIIEERIISYTDSTFEKELGYPTTVQYSNFNKKTTFDYEEEKQKLKDLEGKDIDVIKDMFE